MYHNSKNSPVCGLCRGISFMFDVRLSTVNIPQSLTDTNSIRPYLRCFLITALCINANARSSANVVASARASAKASAKALTSHLSLTTTTFNSAQSVRVHPRPTAPKTYRSPPLFRLRAFTAVPRFKLAGHQRTSRSRASTSPPRFRFADP